MGLERQSRGSRAGTSPLCCFLGIPSSLKRLFLSFVYSSGVMYGPRAEEGEGVCSSLVWIIVAERRCLELKNLKERAGPLIEGKACN